MRFRLTYDGSLKAASQSDTRSKEKWAIRKALEPQLSELWMVHPALQGHQLGYPARRVKHDDGSFATAAFGIEDRRERLREPIEIAGHLFLPLVRDALKLSCSLDILFLRKGTAGSVVTHGGDLDNRIKVLFDGLRLPTRDEMENGGVLDVSPFHCLLEDDRQISSLGVRTDRLLSRPNASSHDVRLIIDVIISPSLVEILTPDSWAISSMPFPALWSSFRNGQNAAAVPRKSAPSCYQVYRRVRCRRSCKTA